MLVDVDEDDLKWTLRSLLLDWIPHFRPQKRNISKSAGIPTASPFCKGGLRGIFLMQPGLIENLPKKYLTR